MERKKKTVDQYEIVGSLGKGAYSTVKIGLAADGQIYAIKIFKFGGKYLSQEESKTISDEIVALKKLKHDNLIKLIGY